MSNKFEIDYDLARQTYPYTEYYSLACVAGLFNPAYVHTNEDLSNGVTKFGNNDGAVLTVAASGDQALMYAINGACHVDTFDVTFCAKAIMDIKTTAVQKYSYQRYRKLLKDLHDVKYKSMGIMDVRGMKNIARDMPTDTGEFVRRMSDCNIFSMTGGADTLVQEQQWSRIRDVVRGPFNFIWSDIADLHKHLDMKYDVINVSNIFEWMMLGYAKQIVPTLRSLFDYLNPGGYIVGTCFNRTLMKFDRNITEMFTQVAQEMSGKSNVHTMQNQMLVTLHKTKIK